MLSIAIRIALATLVALATASAFAAASTPPPDASPGPLVVWHTQDAQQAKLLASIVADFTARTGIAVRLETGVEIGETLMALDDPARMPHAVLAPADLVGLAAQLRLSEIPAALLGATEPTALATVRSKGKIYGMPILRGNHLLLLYNKKLAPKAPLSWEELAPKSDKKGPPPVAIDYENSYNFLAFLATLGGWPLAGGQVRLSGAACRAALQYYKGLADRGVVASTCDYDCTTTRFYKGEFAYALSGDWALRDARQALGPALGVAALPAMGERKMVSPSGTHALVFPAGSLTGPRGKDLEALARYLREPATQRRWWTEGGRIPADEDVLRELQAKLDANDTESLVQLARSRAVEPERAFVLVWPAIRKAMRLHQLGLKTADEACSLMQSLATKAGP
jgi:ABC-type glycerol-3-phosphate transport system substrate-binding protein